MQFDGYIFEHDDDFDVSESAASWHGFEFVPPVGIFSVSVWLCFQVMHWKMWALFSSSLRARACVQISKSLRNNKEINKL